MTHRILDASEWGLVEHEFRQRGEPLPDPAVAFIGASFHDNGELAGFDVCSPEIHLEPLTLYEPRAFRGLHRCMEAELLRRHPGGVRYFVTTAGRSSGMAEAMGIKRCDVELRLKHLSPPVDKVEAA
jgi:hypothetical protein